MGKLLQFNHKDKTCRVHCISWGNQKIIARKCAVTLNVGNDKKSRMCRLSNTSYIRTVISVFSCLNVD